MWNVFSRLDKNGNMVAEARKSESSLGLPHQEREREGEGKRGEGERRETSKQNI